MKNIIIYKLLTILLFTGCINDLDLSPKSQLSDPSFWKSGADFEKAANILYGGLPTHSAGLQDSNSDIADTDGDYNLSAIVPEEDNIWNSGYVTIRRANKIIESYEREKDIQGQTARYAAEARFFRAFQYFQLVIRFGDVPLITKVLKADSEELYAPRTARKKIVTQIMKDLDWAIGKLPLESAISTAEKGRVSKGAAQALKSRVALFEGTWSKYFGLGGQQAYFDQAISAAKAVIDSKEYEVYTEDDEPYYNLFLEKGHRSSERILNRRYALNVSTHNTTRNIETGNNNPTKYLADLYVCTDGLPIDKSELFKGYSLKTSEFENRDPRMAQTIFKPGTKVPWLGDELTVDPLIGTGNKPSVTGYKARKFFSTNGTAQQGQCFYDFMAFRYSEVLLNLAEALYEKNGSISDAELNTTINVLRSRVGVAPLTNSIVNNNGLLMLTEIRRERTVELAYEGFRYNDLRRWKQAESFIPRDFLGIKYKGTEQETSPPNDRFAKGGLNLNSQGFVIADRGSNRKWTEKDYLFPIPLNQIQLNKKLKQNPGW